jgi:hypothetical protein
MKGIPFLLIVLVGVGVIYAYMYMQPLKNIVLGDTVPGMREGMSGIPALKNGPNPFVGPPPSGRPEDKTLNGESHEIPEGVLGEISDNDMPGSVEGGSSLEGFSSPVGTSSLNQLVDEGFQSNGVGCNPRVVRMTNLVAGAAESVRPGALVGAPYGELASTAPQYYRDPENETASRERIITSTAQLRGFLSFEAPLMRSLSDPAVQLPLSQAKADLPRLEQELYFLQQNPGLQSKLKVIDLDTVDSNIDYLQQKYRLGVNTGLIQRPVSFQDSGVSVLRNLVKGIEGFVSGSGPVPSTSASSIVPEFQPEAPTRATLADLNNAITRLTSERTRLAASGTNNPIMSSRVAQIGNMINDIQGVVQQVNDKTLRPDEIPIRKDELLSLFANMGNTDMPLGQLTMTALPASAQNLLPTGLARDSESQNIVAGLIQKYTDAFLKGTSFEFNLGGKYTSENEVNAANRVNVVNVFGSQGRLASVDSAFGPLAGTMPAPNMDTVPNSDNLSMAAMGTGTVPMAAVGDTTDPYAYDPRQGNPGVPMPDARPDIATRRSTAPAHFDWKDRAKTICENARKRGLDPKEFGCLPAKAEVGKDFPWRGYTKMICNRLMSNYYTGTDVACGCPPADWSGWNLTVPPVPNPPRIPGFEPASRPPPNF